MTTPPDPPPDRRSPFEWSLSALRPADPDVARPSFMFKAGQASRDRVVGFWRWVAGGLLLLLVVGAVAGYGLVAAERQRANAAEQLARQLPLKSALPVKAEPPDSDPHPPAASSYRHPPPVVGKPTADDPTPAEIVAALERRRSVLVGGLGLIPDAPAPRPSAEPTGPLLYPGVLAVPKVERKPTPAEPDDPPIPPDDR